MLIRHRAFFVRFFLIASLLTAAMIFCFSAQRGADSQQTSDRITLQVAQVVRPGYEQLPQEARLSFLGAVSTLVRKSAHFLEYALLGFNLMGFARLKWLEWPARRAVLAAWLAATLYAGTDELHQLLVSERSAAVLDVGIDSAGSLAGALVMTLALWLVLRHRASKG